MDNKITYHEQNDIDNTLKLREVLKTLPPFCRDYFRAIRCNDYNQDQNFLCI